MLLYPRKNVTRFVLLFEGRTGSSYLISSLDQHPKVRAMEEGLVILKKEGHYAQAQWTCKALSVPILSRWGAVGFKTKLRDISDPEQFARLLQELNVKIIHMQRRNRIKVTVSEINCNVLYQRTNYYNVYKEQDQLPPISIELEHFKKILKMREDLDNRLSNYVADLGLPILEIYYEDLLIDERSTLKNTYEFLGVPARHTRGKSFKNTSDDLRQALLNFNELRTAFAGTPYESMFDEILAPGTSRNQ